eukprot:11161992-Lingulodinium_polyedra.AAC.1
MCHMEERHTMVTPMPLPTPVNACDANANPGLSVFVWLEWKWLIGLIALHNCLLELLFGGGQTCDGAGYRWRDQPGGLISC